MECSRQEWKESRKTARQIAGSNPRLRRACQAYQIMKKRRKLAKREPTQKRTLAGEPRPSTMTRMAASVSGMFARLLKAANP